MRSSRGRTECYDRSRTGEWCITVAPRLGNNHSSLLIAHKCKILSSSLQPLTDSAFLCQVDTMLLEHLGEGRCKQHCWHKGGILDLLQQNLVCVPLDTMN